MAIRYAVAAGNWSATATWDGGTLPASTDDVYANNKAVTIDQSITVNSLKTTSNTTPAITAGGSFTVTAAATVTITAGIQTTDGGAANAVLAVNAGSAAVTITATANGFTGGNNTSRAAISITSGYTGTLTINGDITGGITSLSTHGLLNGSAACVIIITGNVSGGSTGDGINSSANSTMTVIGDVSGGGGYGIRNSGTSSTLTVTGDVIGGTNPNVYGISSSGASSVTTITGNISGGTATSCYGVNHSGGAMTLRGTLTPGNNATTGIAAVNSSAVFRYSGHVYSGGMSTNTGPYGFIPIQGNWTGITGEEIYLHLFDDGSFPPSNNGTQRILTRYGTDNPIAADVRSGTAYGASGLLTGTLVVPPAASVASGVPVDAGTGTAVLTAAALAAITGDQIAAVFP